MIKLKLYALILATLMCVGLGCGSSDDDPAVTTATLSDGETVKFTLLQTTDVHHRVVGTGPSATYATEADQTKGGYARIATTITGIRTAKAAEGTPVVLVDSGDYLMGTVYDLTLGGVPAAMSFIGLMKYDAITLGNHEFDYGPAPLAGFFDAAMGKERTEFNVPVIASNMVTSDAAPDDDGLEALIRDGRIKDSLLLTLPNGLKVGLLGLMGKNAESDAPLASPVTFTNDLDDDAEVAILQAKVDALKASGAHVVVAMSHSGITGTSLDTPKGDDASLATKVTGIDIIASGHDHEKTDDVVMVGDTRIICAGRYGENLAQLDVTVTIGTGVIDAVLTNNALESDVALASNISFMVAMLDGGINEALAEFFPFKINDIIAFNASSNVQKPALAKETGMGNLVSDSLRYLVGPAQPALGLVANGVVRNGFMTNQGLTFADIYSVLPLGMSLDNANQDIPGYPLLSVLMDRTSIENLCQLIAYTEGAGDEVFMNYLLKSGSDDLLALYGALSNLPADYYMNLSGIRFEHGGMFDPTYSGYKVNPDSIYVYNAGDYKCETPAIPLSILPDLAPGLPPMLPCVLDLYLVLMLQDPGLQYLLGGDGLNIPIKAYTIDDPTAEVTMANVLSCRIDKDAEEEGVQEVKEWMALLQFLTSGEFSEDNIITDAFYGEGVILDGRVGDKPGSRVNNLSLIPPE
ncbi:hypothetical protein DSLASN_26250 [Desulfoluna limicola]|uniref:Calcineurin-like phosphoesterase domain-containing protein n=1 Tax=Desulfoluna limicola TaxID=2810562 RepID=A0ABN6F4U3_9BACT|nr:metallophosphoesterase [Desulfoluna limicola]BCS96993.1 hypothetical protein DSLASN_26250 [Desulfoluna limicola]